MSTIRKILSEEIGTPATVDRIMKRIVAEFCAAKKEPSMPTLKTLDGWSYVITDEDLLWLARAAEGEGGQPADTIWTWFQRYASPGFRGYASLQKLVRAHSQPVNPRWARGGEFCGPGGRYAGQPNCSEAVLQRRARISSLTMDQVGDDVKAAILAIRNGTLANPVPRAVDFADPTVAASFINRNPGAQILYRRSNHFIATVESLRWPDNFVQLSSDGACAWVLVGDSQAVGLRPFLESRMGARGFRLVGTFANVGWGTRQTLSELGPSITTTVQQHQPRLALVVLGGNDTAGDSTRIATEDLVELLKRAGATAVVWVGPAHATPADIAERKRRVAEMQKPLVEGLGGVWLDGREMTKSLTHTPDGVHFVRSSQERWAADLVAALLPKPNLLWALTPFGVLFGDELDRC